MGITWRERVHIVVEALAFWAASVVILALLTLRSMGSAARPGGTIVHPQDGLLQLIAKLLAVAAFLWGCRLFARAILAPKA